MLSLDYIPESVVSHVVHLSSFALTQEFMRDNVWCTVGRTWVTMRLCGLAPENNSGMGNSAHSCLDRETTEGGVAGGVGQRARSDDAYRYGRVLFPMIISTKIICFLYLIIVGVFILFFFFISFC